MGYSVFMYEPPTKTFQDAQTVKWIVYNKVCSLSRGNIDEQRSRESWNHEDGKHWEDGAKPCLCQFIARY